MANNPDKLIRRLFPTNRRLLVEKSLYTVDTGGVQRVLVVGAGHDPYRHYFDELEIYLRLDIENISGATDVVADATQLPICANGVDCIMAVEVMEHIENPFKFVEELERVLEPGGIVVLTVPFMFHEHGDPFDYWRPTSFSLESLFSRFSKVSIVRQGHRLHVLSDMLTTSFSSSKVPIFFPLRILNHFLVHVSCFGASSAPSGFLFVARK